MAKPYNNFLPSRPDPNRDRDYYTRSETTRLIDKAIAPLLGASDDIVNIPGNAGTASALESPVRITIDGDGVALSEEWSGDSNLNINLNLAVINTDPGTYNTSASTITPITVDGKGRVVSRSSPINISIPWSRVTSRPNTLNGYGIVDAVTTTGLGATGTWNISISGNSNKASALATPRSINGAFFDGSVDIETSYWGAERSITIGSTSKLLDGSQNVSWSVNEIGALPTTGGTVSGPIIYSAGSASSPSITFLGSASTGVYLPSANVIAVSTSGTESLRLLSTRQLLIGKTLADTSNCLLEINSDIHINGLTLGRGGGDGNSNTAFGWDALESNTTGTWNVAVGRDTLRLNTAGGENVAVGYSAMALATTGSNNTAIGAYTLYSNATSNENTAVGYNGQYNNVLGQANTSLGYEALFSNVSGNNNLALGWKAGRLVTGSNNICIGYNAGVGLTTGDSNVIIGNVAGVAGLANTIILAAGTSERLRIDSGNNLKLGGTADRATTIGTNQLVFYNGTPPAGTLTNGCSLYSSGGQLYVMDSSGTAQAVGAPESVSWALVTDKPTTLSGFGITDAPNFGTNDITTSLNGGKILVGTTTARANLYNATETAPVQVEGVGGNSTRYLLTLNANNSAGGGFIFAKSRGTTVGSNTLVNSGDQLGVVSFQGSDGAQFIEAASIEAAAEGTPAADNMPGRLSFKTVGSGTSTTERMRLDSTGRLMIGAIFSRNSFFNSNSTPGSQLQVEGAGISSVIRNIGDNNGAAVIIAKTRSANNTIVNSGDEIGIVSWQGNDGTEFVEAARIRVVVDGTPGANDMPGALTFQTTLDGAATSTERMRINNAGNVLIGKTTSRNTGAGVASNLQIESTGVATQASFVGNSSATNLGGVVILGRSRADSVGGVTLVQNGDSLGQIRFAGADGSDLVSEGARISAITDSTVSVDNLPTSLVFWTTGTGGNSPTEKARLNSAGKLLIGKSLADTSDCLLEIQSDAFVNGLRVGKGGGNLSTNTTLGVDALQSNTTGPHNTAIGYQAMSSNTGGEWSTAVGYQALFSNTTGTDNTAVGYQSMFSNTEGFYNTAVGEGALYANTLGDYNTAVGIYSLENSTTGRYLTACGMGSLQDNTVGEHNSAFGWYALLQNVTGSENVACGNAALRKGISNSGNTAIGYAALTECLTSGNVAVGHNCLFYSTTGTENVGVGASALYSSSTGDENVAIGFETLKLNTTGSWNVGIGSQALSSNTTGENNVGVGWAALQVNTAGANNVGVGEQALNSNVVGTDNTGIGYNALIDATGSYNTALGSNALGLVTSGNGNIGIGTLTSSGVDSPVFSVTTENDRIVMGSTAVTNAYIQVGWTVVSDERDKTNFAPVPHGLDFVNSLKPTSYQFRVNRSSEQTIGPVRYGFKAQDILKLEGEENPVIIDSDNPDKLRYNSEALVPVLVNAIQELTTMVNDLKAELATLKNN